MKATSRCTTSAAIAAIALLAGLPTVLAQQPAAAGDAARGKELYYQHACYACHGPNGQTGVRNLVGTGSPIIANVDTFVAYLRLRDNIAPSLPSTGMPSYSPSTLSDAEARDIFAYIRTFALDSPAAEDVAPLRAILESAKYIDAAAAIAPALLDRDLPNATIVEIRFR